MAGQVASFPWEALDRLDRVTVRAARGLHQHLQHTVRSTKLAAALSEVVGQEAVLLVRVVRIAATPCTGAVSLRFQVGDRTQVVIVPERQLAATLLGGLLARPVRLDLSPAPFEPELRGALSAVVLEVLRRAAPATPSFALNDSSSSPTPLPDVGVELSCTVILDSVPYAASAWLAPLWPLSMPTPSLPDLGPTPIALPIVAGLATSTRHTLASLRLGDVWCCAEGWQIDANGCGLGVLAAPMSDVGVPVDLMADGGMVLREGTISVPWEANPDMSETKTPATLADQVLDAPVVVRVEVGAISMPARDWAVLQPGDVIETSRRLAEPVVLRVGGVEVASGELVNVDGHLGVRILQLMTAGESP